MSVGNVVPFNECVDGPGCTFQHGLIAVGQACPTFADVEIVSQDAAGRQLHERAAHGV